ncbi:hypothetical protein Hdeb2414_s0136g00808761 [Helianthus debilis subsp. tardiflorus]
MSRKYLAMASAPCLKLISSPELKALFSIDEFILPSWCMPECLTTLEEMLESQPRITMVRNEIRLQEKHVSENRNTRQAFLLRKVTKSEVLHKLDCCQHIHSLRDNIRDKRMHCYVKVFVI